MDDLRYPVGRFAYQPPTPEVRAEALAHIERLPAELRAAVHGLTDRQLDTPYRPEGWTVRQVVHHVADSETNAAIRLRRLLVEDAPHIIGYDEGRWAERLRYDRPIATSLALIAAVRAASLELLLTVAEAEWARILSSRVSRLFSNTQALKGDSDGPQVRTI